MNPWQAQMSRFPSLPGAPSRKRRHHGPSEGSETKEVRHGSPAPASTAPLCAGPLARVMLIRPQSDSTGPCLPVRKPLRRRQA